MNKGIKVTKGEYLLFLNSGDWLYDDEVLFKATIKMEDSLDIYYGDLVFCDDKSNERCKYPETLSFKFFYEKSLPHPATFIKRELFDIIFLYNENLKIVSDWEFFIYSICKYNASYKYLDFTISNFDTKGISSKKEKRKLIIEERAESLNKYFPLFIEDTRDLIKANKILETHRFKMLIELENSVVSKKINSLILRISLILFRGKTLKKL